MKNKIAQIIAECRANQTLGMGFECFFQNYANQLPLSSVRGTNAGFITRALTRRAVGELSAADRKFFLDIDFSS